MTTIIGRQTSGYYPLSGIKKGSVSKGVRRRRRQQTVLCSRLFWLCASLLLDWCLLCFLLYHAPSIHHPSFVFLIVGVVGGVVVVSLLLLLYNSQPRSTERKATLTRKARARAPKLHYSILYYYGWRPCDATLLRAAVRQLSLQGRGQRRSKRHCIGAAAVL